MAELNFDVRELQHIPHAVLVSMQGSIDASTVVNFQSTLENLQLKGIKRFILDMEQIRYVNSTGLGSLVRLADQLESDGGGFALVKIHPKVKVVFDMLGLNAFFKIFPSLDSAEEHFKQQSAAKGEGGAPPPPAPAAPSKGPTMKVTNQPPPPPRPVGGQPPPPPAMQGRQPPPPPQPAAQPRAIRCEGCGVTLRIGQPGTFKCSRCNNMFVVHPDGRVEFPQLAKPQPVAPQAQPVHQVPPLQPMQITLTCREECKKALTGFLTSLAQSFGFSPERLQTLGGVIGEITQHILVDGYGNNPQGQYTVLVAPAMNEMNIKFADQGRPYNIQANPRLFANARRFLAIFDLKPHPQGGNILTIKMTAM